jgi:transcriptional regulator with XRE-family HTH domain
VKELGRRVRARRLKLGKSQSAIARAVGRSHSWLSNLENGKGGDVPAEVLTALAIELSEEPTDYLRLAGRAVLRAEGVTPVDLDPRVVAAIDQAVERGMDRLMDRLAERVAAHLREPGIGA